MLVRYKSTGSVAISSRFNPSCVGEVLTECDSAFINELDVWLENTNPPSWKSMADAFRDRDLITDDYVTVFFEPRGKEEHERGYALG